MDEKKSRSRRPAGDTLARQGEDETRALASLTSSSKVSLKHLTCTFNLQTRVWDAAPDMAILDKRESDKLLGALQSVASAALGKKGPNVPRSASLLQVRFEFRRAFAGFDRRFLASLFGTIREYLTSGGSKVVHRRIERNLVSLTLLTERAPSEQYDQALRAKLSESTRQSSETGALPRDSEKIPLGSSVMRGVEDVAAAIADAIETIRRLPSVTESRDPLPVLQRLQTVLTEIRKLLGNEIMAVFNSFAGERFNLNTGQSVALLLDQTAKSLGLLFEFTSADGVVRQGSLRCQATGRDRQPTFQLQSTDEDGTRSIHAASRSLPVLALAPAGRRRKLKSRPRATRIDKGK